MNKTLLTGLALALAANVGAGERIERSIDCSGTPLIHVINAAGDIEITGATTDTCEIDASIGNRVQRLDIKERGDRIKIEVVYDSSKRRDSGTSLEIVVPRGVGLKVSATSADISVDGVNGGLSLQSVSGDVQVETRSNAIWASSTSGDVEVEGGSTDGKAELSSTSGSVEAFSLAGYLNASTVSGDIEVAESRLDTVKLNAVSGSIEVMEAVTPDVDLDAESVSGSIELSLHAGFSGRVDISTLTGGIDNCFGPKPVRTSRYGPGRTLNFEQGDGGKGRIRAGTVNGGVDLCMD
ncbi:MAG: DUF4097 family beta strand repeat-containing protein [Pseudomonadota bacterium]